jgi:hypothetical protein
MIIGKNLLGFFGNWDGPLIFFDWSGCRSNNIGRFRVLVDSKAGFFAGICRSENEYRHSGWSVFVIFLV